MAIAGILGAALSVASPIFGGFLGAKEKKSQKKQAKANAALAFQRAEQIRKATSQTQVQQTKQGQRDLGGIEAELGASGMRMGEGVGADIIAEQKSQIELENMQIGEEGIIQAGQAQSEGAAYLQQARYYQRQARNSILTGFLGAGSSLGSMLPMPSPAPSSFSTTGTTKPLSWNTTSSYITPNSYSPYKSNVSTLYKGVKSY